MGLKVRLRELRIRALEAGPGRLVLTLGEGAALDPFHLAKKVQASDGALRLTPDMKLVVRLGDPRPVAPPGPPAKGSARSQRTVQAVRQAVAAAMPTTPTPAQEAAAGRELLRAAREALGELAKLARNA
jgi:transcription-repair coupling factor (superfamily II helicase)